MVKKKNKKPKSVEEELKQVQHCLKNKDKRIESLELVNKDAKDRTNWYIRNFNFLSLVAFVGALSVLIYVCSLLDPEWFEANMIHIAIIGTFVCVSNFLASAFSIIFDTDYEYSSDFFVIFNGILIPIVVVFYGFVLSILWR